MKKITATIVAAVLAVAMAAAPAVAGDHGWATAGKILTGWIGLNILANAIANPYPYPPPAAAYVPPPRAYDPYPPGRVWVPGHYEIRMERRWVPGHWEIGRADRYVDRYEGYDDDDGGYRRGGSVRVWVPGRYQDVEVEVWIRGHWEG